MVHKGYFLVNGFHDIMYTVILQKALNGEIAESEFLRNEDTDGIINGNLFFFHALLETLLEVLMIEDHN
jgi:hypothetical protein